jgi:hypothetical protein
MVAKKKDKPIKITVPYKDALDRVHANAPAKEEGQKEGEAVQIIRFDCGVKLEQP